MASFSLVHGAWHGAWCWDALAGELRQRGHDVSAVDLPSDDPAATLRDYAAAVEPADIVVGHSLGGLTIPLVAARRRVYLCALVAPWGAATRDIFAEGALEPGFPNRGVTRDEHGRSVWMDEAFALESMYGDCDPAMARQVYARLRPQAAVVYEGTYPLAEPPPGAATTIVGTLDAAVSVAWSRSVAASRLGVEPVEIAASHSPMLSQPSQLADLLDALT